jgi:hypothetical protein
MLNKFPSREVAEKELETAAKLNPGRWVGHSKNTGLACRYIAEKCSDLDAEKAYSLGILHDIGRRVGIVSTRHLIEGYRYCMAQGWDDVAKICITHSFMIKNIETDIGVCDVTPEDYDFMKRYIDSVTYDDYDTLIQLCDGLALDTGFCLMEKRFVDVTRRHGAGKYTVERWNEDFKIKEYFEKKMGCSIYNVLPGVIENTFRD